MGFIHDYMIRQGHLVDSFCADEVPKKWSGRITRLTFPVLVRQRAIEAARAGKPYDLINIHEPSASVMSTFRKAANNPAIVVTSYGVERRAWELSLATRRFKGDGPSLKTRLIYPPTILWQSRWGLLKADHILCSNSEDGDYLVRKFKISPQKITRMFSGADPAYARGEKTRDYSSANRLLFAASWIKRKGIDDLVPAFTTLASRYPNLTLTVLAAEISEREIRSAFPPELGPRIFCLSTQNERKNIDAYAATDIYVLPSLFEGTPLTLIEAMMSGMPIVTTATCGMKDVIRHEQNGLLIPLRSAEAIVSAVERLMNDSELRVRLGQTAQREALEKYSWEKVAEPILSVYERLCLRRNGHSDD
jgi:glycosyltransferase involved in cell wall biosynthesis